MSILLWTGLLCAVPALAAPPAHLRVAAKAPATWGALSREKVPVRLWWDGDSATTMAIQVARGGEWRALAVEAVPGWESPPLALGAAIRVGQPGDWSESVFVPTWISPVEIAQFSGPKGASLAAVVGQIDQLPDHGLTWASTLGGGLLTVSPSGVTRSLTRWDGLPSDRVLAVDGHGDRVLAGTAAGAVLLKEGRTLQVWDAALPSPHAQAVLLSDNQQLVGTDAGLAEVFADRVVSDGPPAVYSIAQARGGGAWVGMGGLRFRAADGAPVGQTLAAEGDRIYGISEQRDGMRIVSQEHGLLKGVVQGGVPALMPVARMPTSGAFGLAHTVDGVWVAAGEQGLIGPGGRGYGFVDGLPGRAVWSVASAGDGALWVGTDQGLARFVPGLAEMAPHVAATPVVRWPVGAQVSALLPTKYGLWVGGMRGVWSLGRPHRAVANLTVASPRQTRAVVEGGGFTWAIGERIVRMDKRGRLASVVLPQRVLSATWARGALWLGTGEGILRLHPETLSLEPILALGGVTRLLPIERGFWALAEGAPTRIIGRIARPYLVSHPVRDLAPMGGGVCLATDDGLAILFPDGEVLDPLGEADQGVAVVAVAGDGEGGCWYVSRTGLVGRVSAADEHTSRKLPLDDDATAQRIVADGDWAWVVTDQGTWRIRLKPAGAR